MVQTFVTPAQPIYEVDVADASGEVETIETTVEHPFWVDGLGWTPASRLQPGDVLVGESGGWLEVRQVRGSPRRETVYNFEVAETHSYFVGESGAWVHNDCGRGYVSGFRELLEKARAARRGDMGALGEIQAAKILRSEGVNVHLQTPVGRRGPRSPLRIEE